MRHWETTSDHPTGLYRGWNWGHTSYPNVLFNKFFFENFFLKFLFLKNAPFYHNLSSFLVYTGCRSGIRHYKFNFCTLYIPKILSQVYLEWNNDVAFFKYQKSMTKKKFKISKNYVASDSTSVEACREVRGCISLSHFFVKISYLNIFSLIFWSSYQKSGNFWPKPKRWGELCCLRFSLRRGL